MRHYETKEEAIQSLKSDHFSCEFVFDDGKLCCTDNHKCYLPSDLYLVEYHRFTEEEDQVAVIYAILANDGAKGIIEYRFGAKVNMDIITFLDKVRIAAEEIV